MDSREKRKGTRLEGTVGAAEQGELFGRRRPDSGLTGLSGFSEPERSEARRKLMPGDVSHLLYAPPKRHE